MLLVPEDAYVTCISEETYEISQGEVSGKSQPKSQQNGKCDAILETQQKEKVVSGCSGISMETDAARARREKTSRLDAAKVAAEVLD